MMAILEAVDYSFRALPSTIQTSDPRNIIEPKLVEILDKMGPI